MVRKLKRVVVLITFCCLLAVMTYQTFQPIFSSEKGNTMILLHSSVVEEKRIAESAGKTPNTSTITIDRKLLDYLKFHLPQTPYAGVGTYTRFTRAILDLKELTHINAIRPNMGPVINDVTTFKYPITIASCGQNTGKKSHRSVFVSVMSTPDNVEKRSIIRQTWATHLKKQSNVNKQLDVLGFGFVVGLTDDKVVQKKIAEESELHGDILQVNVYEEYGNLSVKTAGLLSWVNINCLQVDYLLKVDDDVYVNVHNLATVLYAFSPSVRRIYGRITGGGIAPRKENEWPFTFETWPWTSIPKYLEGGGVVIAGTAVRPLLAAMQTTPYFVKEDIYLTGLCAEKAGLQIRTSFRVFVDRPHTYPDPCFARNYVMWSSKSEDHMITSHLVTENFYRNATNVRCFVTTYVLNPNETLGMIVERKINVPATFSEFHFKSVIPQNKWVTIIPTPTNRSVTKKFPQKFSS